MEKYGNHSAENYRSVADHISIVHTHILVAEDHNDTRLLLRTMLEKHPGIMVVEAANGEIAAALTMSLRIDMVLIDRDLALLDGYSVTKRIRAHKSFSNLPIIMMSHCSDSFARAKAFETGCNDYIVKPFPLKLLSTLIQRHVFSNAA